MAEQKFPPGRSFLSRPQAAAAILLLATIVVVSVGLAYGVIQTGGFDRFSPQALEATIKSWGMWGVLASIGLMVIHSFIPFPAEFVAIANGICFGPYLGTVVTWTGAMIGAFLAFGLARALGRPFVGRMAATRNLQQFDDWFARRGGHAIFLGRLLPVISFNLINYAAGLTRVSWTVFAVATGLGILPVTVLMVVIGDQAGSLRWQHWLVMAGAGVLMWLAVRPLFRKLTQAPADDAP